MTDVQGYSPYTIFIVLGVGLLLATWRPYMGFLFALLLVTAGHVNVFNQTRTAALGPYLNLADACMLVAFVAFCFDKLRMREPVWMPQIVALMLLVLIIAAAQSFWKLGWTYETVRACRWAVQLPLAFFLGANLVTTAERTKQLIATLAAAACLAAVQHVAFAAYVWRTKSVSMETYHLIRTIGYWAGCMPSAFLIGATLWTRPRGLLKGVLYVAIGGLFLGSVFLSQTRSLWIATAAAMVCVIFLFKARCKVTAVVTCATVLLLLFVTLGWVGRLLLPGLEAVRIVATRTGELLHNEAHTGTRLRSFVAETGSWMEGTLVFGRGLAFYQTTDDRQDGSQEIAFGHLGYVTYLAQLGLIGLLVYGILLPLGVLRNGLGLWRNGGSSVIRFAGLLGGASIVCLSLMFVMSSQFLSPGYEAPGVLYGAMWALSRIRHLFAADPPDSLRTLPSTIGV